MTSTQQAVAGAIGLLGLLAFAYLGAQVGLGAFDEHQRIELVLDETGQGLVAGSDVSLRGVVVGSVDEVVLGADHRAVVQLALDPDLRLPERTRVKVTSKTVMGPKRVDLLVDGPLSEGPHLAEGARLEQTTRVVEVEDVLDHLAPALRAIDPADLVVIADDLLGALEDHGAAMGDFIDRAAAAADLAARTVDDGVAVTSSSRLIAAELRGAGPSFNRLSRGIVEDLPALTDNAEGLGDLADELARASASADRTLTLTRPDLDRLLADGASVTRLLFEHRQQVGEVISGLTLYSSKFANGFEHPSIRGLAARFAVQIETRGLADPLCTAFGEEGLPACAVAAELPVRNALPAEPAP